MKRALVGIWFVIAIATQAAHAFDNSEIASQCQDSEYLLELFTVGGRPINRDPNHSVKILVNHSYAVGYCEERRNPLWAVYRASELVTGQVTRFERPQLFPRDLRVNPSVDGRTFGNNYDRGHMVPNAAIGNQYGTLAQAETFLMTNMCPQHRSLNRGQWQALEAWIPQMAQDTNHVYVICGPIFGADPNVVARGPERGIQIPEAFYMILVDPEREWQDRPTIRLLAYRFPQNMPAGADFRDRNAYGASVDQIEAATDLDFFPLYDDLFTTWDAREAQIEAVHW